MHNILYGAALTVTVEGDALEDFLNSSNLQIVNQVNEPAFYSGGCSVVIDITVGPLELR